MTRTRVFFACGLLLALFLAGVVSNWASSDPDGLDKVGRDLGFSSSATTHASDGSPLAGYSTKGVEHPWLSTAVSGVTGVAITLAIGGGLFLVLRRRGARPGEHPAERGTPGRGGSEAVSAAPGGDA
ncbi:MAG: PDGLE domain-containing protein [Kineosporiaceae bacterium]